MASVRISCTPWEKFRIAMLFSKFCFPLQKCSKNLTVDSEPSASRLFRKRQEWSYPKERDEIYSEKNCSLLYLFSDILNHYKHMSLENSLFLMLLNMFVEKRLSTGIKSIRFHLQWLIILDFWWMQTLSERYTIMRCVPTGPIDTLLWSQGWAQWKLSRPHGCITEPLLGHLRFPFTPSLSY